MGIVFVRKCLLCGTVLSGPEDGKRAMLCPACAAEVREKYRLAGPVRVKGADGAAAALYYTGAVKSAMQRFKFRHMPHYADWFAAQTAPLLAANLEYWRPELVTFAPIGRLHYYQRGYNQAELLASRLAKPFDLPCKAALKRRMFTGTQSARHSAAERWKNAARVFAPAKGIELSGRAVVFVDDIITTGATAANAVRLLREMGAARVFVLAACKVP